MVQYILPYVVPKIVPKLMIGRIIEQLSSGRIIAQPSVQSSILCALFVRNTLEACSWGNFVAESGDDPRFRNQLTYQPPYAVDREFDIQKNKKRCLWGPGGV